MSDTERDQRPGPAQNGTGTRRDVPTATPNGAQSPRRRVERPVADAGSAAREASRLAQERARSASQDRGHSR